MMKDNNSGDWNNEMTNTNKVESFLECGLCLKDFSIISASLPNEVKIDIEANKITPTDYFLELITTQDRDIEKKDLITKINKKLAEAEQLETIDDLLLFWVSLHRYHLGWTRWGLQMWCPVHDANVCHVNFEGHKHDADLSRQKRIEEYK